SCHNGSSRAVGRRASDVDDGSEDSLSGQAAQSQARTTAGQEGRPRQRPAQALPVLQGQDRARRLQGRRHAAALHLRARQDPLAADHRRLPPPPEPDRPSGQARAGARAAAVRQRHARTRARRARGPRGPRGPGPGSLAVPEAILLKDVEGIGERGTVIDVSKGYLRNYLIPRKLAQPATRAAIQAAQRRTDAESRAKEQAVTRSQEHADLLNRTVLTISQQAGEDGRLFGSVTTQDIVEAIRDARGITVDRRKVHLEEPIRHVGTYMVVVEVDDGVTSTVKTIVTESEAGCPACS